MALPTYNFGLTIRYPLGHAQQGQPYSGCNNVELRKGETVVDLTEIGSTAFYFASGVPAGKWMLWVNNISSGQSFGVGEGELAGLGYEAGKTLQSQASSIAWGLPTASWENITDKPTAFTPSAHGHTLLEISGSSSLLTASQKGSAGGLAELDGSGKVPAAQLPSYVDDVVEASSLSAFPGVGETGKIYVALDTNKTYRWSGSAYIEISQSLALGETSGTAYRGDRGKAAFDHSQATGNPHGTTIATIAGLQDALDAKLDSTVYTWTRNGISSAGWAKILSATLPSSSTQTCNWIFNVIQLGSTAGTNSRIGKLRIQWRNGALSADFTLLDGGDSSKFGYTGTLAVGSLFEVYAYCDTYPYLKLSVENSCGGDISGGVFSTADPSMEDISTVIFEEDWDHNKITASSNFNDYASPGVHKVSNAAAATDFPPGAYGYGSLAVFVYGAGDLVQVYFPHRSNGVSNAGIRMRVCYGGAWQGWVIIHDAYYLATVFASKDSVNAFSQMNTFGDRVAHASPPEYPVTPSGTTSGNITWNNDTAQSLILTAPLTGAVTIIITNPREGRVTSLSYIQGSAKRTVAFSATGVNFWVPGSTSANNGALVLSGIDSINARYSYRLTWYSTTLVVVSRESW